MQDRRPRPCSIAVWLAACSCTHHTLPSFEVSDEVETIVYVVEVEGRAPEAYAVGGSVLSYAIPIDEGARLTAIPYAYSTDELQLDPGPIALEGSRALPEAAAFVRASGSESWQAIERLPDSIAALALPALDLDRCVAGGGCLEVGDRSLCRIPCPTGPDPQPPQPPEPPLPPQTRNEQKSCAPPWTLREGVVITCEPPQRPDIAPREAACAEQPSSVVDLHEALARSRTIELGAGEYRLARSVKLAGPVTITGACSAKTIIRSNEFSLGSGDTLALRNLTLDRVDLAGLPGATIILEGVRFTGGGAIDVAGELSIRDSHLEARSLITRGGRAHFERVRFGGETRAPITSRGTELLIERSGFHNRYLTVFGGSADLRELYFAGEDLARYSCLQLLRGARATAERILVDAPCSAIHAHLAATATITDLVAIGRRGSSNGLTVQTGARATFRGARILDHGNGGASSAWVRIEDAELAGGRYGWVEDTGGVLHAERLHLHDLSNDALNLDGRASITDVEASNVSKALLVTSSAAADISRIRVTDSLAGLEVSGRATTATISDVELSNIGHGVYMLGGSMTLRRMRATELSVHPFHASYPCARAKIEDFELDQAASAGDDAVFVVEDGASLELDRAKLSRVTGGAFKLQTKRDTRCPARPIEFTARNVEVLRPSGTGFLLDTEDTEDEILLDRVLIEGAAIGADLRGPLTASLRELTIAGAVARGLDLGANVSVDAETFALSDIGESAVRSSGQTSVFRPRSGTISATPVGIELIGQEMIDRAQFLERVFYRDVTRWIEHAP